MIQVCVSGQATAAVPELAFSQAAKQHLHHWACSVYLSEKSKGCRTFALCSRSRRTADSESFSTASSETPQEIRSKDGLICKNFPIARNRVSGTK